MAFGSGISSGDIGGALTELGKMWGIAGLILIILLRIITHIYILRQRSTESGKQIGYGPMMLNLFN